MILLLIAEYKEEQVMELLDFIDLAELQNLRAKKNRVKATTHPHTLS